MVTPANEHAALAAINLAIDSLPESEQDAIRAGVELAMRCPRAVVHMAALLAAGDTPAHRGQTAQDHVDAAYRHLIPDLDIGDGLPHADPDSGRPTLAHVAARACLAIEAAEGGR